MSRACPACGAPLRRRPAESERAFARRKTCGCRAKNRGEKPGEKSRWLSRYGGGYLSDAQWLAEVMCARRAARERRELKHRFWDGPGEASYFREQLTHAARLLKRFPAAAVLAALNGPDGAGVYTLGAAKFAGLVAATAARLAKAPAPGEPPAPAPPSPWLEPPPLSFTPAPVAAAPNLLSRLRGKEED